MTTKVNLSSAAGVTGILPKANGGTGGTVGATLALTPIVGTSATAVAGNHYYTTNALATALTFPASAAEGDAINYTTTNGKLDNSVLRNGLTLMGAADDITLDIPDITTCWMYINSTWRII
jgi:hypothetical protein